MVPDPISKRCAAPSCEDGRFLAPESRPPASFYWKAAPQGKRRMRRHREPSWYTASRGMPGGAVSRARDVHRHGRRCGPLGPERPGAHAHSCRQQVRTAASGGAARLAGCTRSYVGPMSPRHSDRLGPRTSEVVANPSRDPASSRAAPYPAFDSGGTTRANVGPHVSPAMRSPSDMSVARLPRLFEPCFVVQLARDRQTGGRDRPVEAREIARY
jgi:hypothetical protein